MQISLGLFIGVAVALALIVGIITHFVTVSQSEKKCRKQDWECRSKSKRNH